MKLVGRLVVGAIPKTPAWGPRVLLTTPPISSLSIRIASPADCWALILPGEPVHNKPSAAAMILTYNSFVVVMSLSFVGRCEPSCAPYSDRLRTVYSSVLQLAR